MLSTGLRATLASLSDSNIAALGHHGLLAFVTLSEFWGHLPAVTVGDSLIGGFSKSRLASQARLASAHSSSKLAALPQGHLLTPYH